MATKSKETMKHTIINEFKKKHANLMVQRKRNKSALNDYADDFLQGQIEYWNAIEEEYDIKWNKFILSKIK